MGHLERMRLAIHVVSVENDGDHARSRGFGHLERVRLAIHVVFDPKVADVHQIHSTYFAAEAILVKRMPVNPGETT